MTATLEELALQYRSGNTEALDEIITRCSNIVRNASRRYFLIGADTEDVYQEGFLGLIKAAKTFDAGKGNFRSYAYTCVNSAVVTAVRKYSRLKNKALNDGVPLSDYTEFADDSFDPEAMYIEGENRRELTGNIFGELTPLERKVLSLYLKGLSYSEICLATGKPFKSVDNALQRIKKKLKKLL